MASIYSKPDENSNDGKVRISRYNLYVSDIGWWGALCGGTINCNAPSPSTTTTGQYLKMLNPHQIDLMYQHSVFMEKSGWSAPSDGRGFVINGTPYYIDHRWFLTYAGSALSASVSNSVTSLPINDLSKFSVGDNVEVGGVGGQSAPEMMLVTAKSAATGAGSLSVIRAQFDENGKFPAVAHNSGDFVRTIVHAFGAQDFLAMNMSSQAPVSSINPTFGAQTWNQFLASFWQAKIAGETSYSNLDGMYLDNFVGTPSEILDNYASVDYTNSNAATSLSTGNSYFTSGMADFASQMRTKLGNRLLVANVGGTGQSIATNSAFLNGGMIEGVDYNGSNIFVDNVNGNPTIFYNNWESSGAAPQTFIYNGSNSAQTTLTGAAADYRALRYLLTRTMMNNGYLDYDEFLVKSGSGGGQSYGHQASWWYDEFDNSGKGAGYLGSPLGAAVTVTAAPSGDPGNGVQRRNFTNGIAINNDTGAVQTVSLGGSFTKLTASGRCPDNSADNGATCDTTPQTALATGNDGSTVSSVTLQPHDGVILLGGTATSSSTVTPTATPTSSSSTYNYDFEGTTQGWVAGGAVGVTQVSNSAAVAYSGTQSLAVAVTNASQTNWGSAFVTNPTGLMPGATINIHVLEPSGLPTGLAASIVVQSASWNEETPVALTPGTWATLSYTVPTNVTLGTPYYLALRLQPTTSTATWSGTVYVDAVSY